MFTESLDILSFKNTEPDVAFVSPKITLPTVDFPQPDSPTKPSVSPGAIVKLISSTALTAPICLEKRIPFVIEKYFTRLSTLSSG